MDSDQRFLYRGTTVEWPGNESARRERLTCATTDPLVAVLFAIQARNYGPAVVHLFEMSETTEFLPSNPFAEIEAEVVVALSPREFAEASRATVDVLEAVEVLNGLGFDLPLRLPSDQRLTRVLEISYERGERLTAQQKHQFNRILVGAEP